MKQTEAYLRATVSPSNASYKTVTWSSSDNTIASVTNGVVYGKKPGNATITCTTTHGGKTATCEVTVTDIERLATGLELYKSAYWKNGQSMVPYSSINEGDTLTFMELGIGYITINVLPYSVTNGEINWKVSDPSIVATELTEHINFANSIRINPLYVGTTKITISTTDGTNISKDVYVKITPDPTIKVRGARCLQKEITLAVGETDTLEANVLPIDATNKHIYWSSNNMFSVSATSVDGTDGHRACIKAKQKGKHYVVAKSDDGGYTDTCVVIVIPERISVTGLTLNHASKTLHKGETLQLTPVFTPANPTNPNVYWYMNNDSVVTLNNGLVTAIQEGTVTITCVSEDGNYEATCGVTVTNEEPPVVEPITVRLKASSAMGWSIVNLYYWGDDITGPAWPGITINRDANGWYSHTFDASVTSVNLIWNDGNNQTVDITNVTESTCYSLKSTSGKTIGVNVVECQATTPVSVSGVSLNKKTLQMVVGNSATLTASVLPANASNKTVTWTSSNTATATISSTGTISAKAEGVTTITCKTIDGNYTAECYVVVSAANSEYTFSYEPTNATVINYTATELSYNEIPENNCVFAILADNAHTLNLMYLGSLVNGVIPPGNYKITSTLQNGTFCYSVGGDDQYDYGSYLATDYDSEGYYTSSYYIIAGDIIIGSNNNYTVKVISANGTDINVTYNGTQDVENISSDIKAAKILRDGQILILRGDKTYTLQGQEVK
ncbi:MAG: Ig domain-containing protein [Paludibacteraceae bacterium]|nr:Ig domain-containing protein [Paludibacteraceae bacterium]